MTTTNEHSDTFGRDVFRWSEDEVFCPVREPLVARASATASDHDPPLAGMRKLGPEDQGPSEAATRPNPSRPAAAVPAGWSDALLVRRLSHHDESVLRKLVEVHGRHVYAKAFQVLRDAQMAEEVAQETLFLLWREPHRFDGSRGSLRSYLMGVARFKAIDVVRREERVHSKESLASESTAFFDSPAADCGVEDAMMVRAAISKLPFPKREVLFLAYYKGLTYREVADLLDLPEGTVKTRIRDALIKLRTLIARPESC